MPGRALKLVEPRVPNPVRGTVLLRERSLHYLRGRGLLLVPALVGVILLLGGPLREGIRQSAGIWLFLLLLSGGLAMLLTPASELLALALGAVAWPDRRRNPSGSTPCHSRCPAREAMLLLRSPSATPSRSRSTTCLTIITKPA